MKKGTGSIIKVHVRFKSYGGLEVIIGEFQAKMPCYRCPRTKAGSVRGYLAMANVFSPISESIVPLFEIF